jgi:phospholipase A1
MGLRMQLVSRCFLPLLLTAPLAASAAAQQDKETFQVIQARPGLSLHKEMFMLPLTYSDEYHGKQVEAVFQLSAKHRLFDTRLYFAYTQISFWQAYDEGNSAPFRETNYNPELFYRSKPLVFSSWQAGADIGFEHESNGQRPPVSRSWNLIHISPYFYRSDILLHLKLRYRIPEDEKVTPEASEGDDNPDITDYLGYTDLNIYYRFWNNHNLHLMVRGNLNTGKGGMSLSYSFPVPRSQRSFVDFRLTQGYGESLVDYKKSLTRIGVGIMFVQ